MTDTKLELTFTQVINAPPEDVFYVFATAQGWRNWLCDSARFEVRPGGCYQLAWNSGWYAAGTVRKCTRPERVALTWFGMGDPGPTDVTIELNGKDGGTVVELRHSGFNKGDDWQKSQEEVREVWQTGFENLASIFSSGRDLRITRRPMLGIGLNDFDEKIAKELGVPVAKGMRINQTLEGMGAERAGLQPNDVIVEMDDKAIRGFADLTAVLEGKQAGDVVTVVVYRGAERVAVEMELSPPPIAEVPLDPAAMAERLRATDAEIMEELLAFFKGVSEAEADFYPSPEEWSAKETLAHLIVGEMGFQDWITSLINDNEPEYGENWTNVRARLKAVLIVTPTIPELLNRLETSKEETASLLELAEALKARKGVLWRLGQALLQFPGLHERSHIDQMRAAIEAAREV